LTTLVVINKTTSCHRPSRRKGYRSEIYDATPDSYCKCIYRTI